MDTIDITFYSLLLTLLLVGVPVVLSGVYRLKLCGHIFYSVSRMACQLVLIGIFLKYLFLYNNSLINVCWLTVMILVAVYSAITHSSLKFVKVFVPTFVAFVVATFTVIFYLNIFVIKLDNIFAARYLIVLGGMLLGNSLRGNIVGISDFYDRLRKDKKKFLYVLALGATRGEAIAPYLRESVNRALAPTFAAMTTMGIVALPGMMTGVILGGASPEMAIKYQIMIMLAIMVSTIVSVVLAILMTLPITFTKAGVLRDDVFA